MKISSCLIAPFLLVFAVSQETAHSRLNYTNEILAAGDTGDQGNVATLQRISTNLSHEEGKGAAAQMALAKLGDIRSRQEIFCEAQFGDDYEVYYAITEKLPYMQGAYSVDVLRLFLTPETRNTHGLAWSGGILPSAQTLAVSRLKDTIFKIATSGPSKANEWQLSNSDDPAFWQAWTTEHRSLFELSPPHPVTPFSPKFCLKYLKKERKKKHAR